MTMTNMLGIPDENMPLVLNSLIHERVLNVERRLNTQTASFEWKRADGAWVGADALVDFAGDLHECYSLLTVACQSANLGSNIIYKPDGQGHWAVVLLQIVDDQPRISFQVNGAPLEHLVCFAILSRSGGGDCQQLAIEQNKLLFPAVHLSS